MFVGVVSKVRLLLIRIGLSPFLVVLLACSPGYRSSCRIIQIGSLTGASMPSSIGVSLKGKI